MSNPHAPSFFVSVLGSSKYIFLRKSGTNKAIYTPRRRTLPTPPPPRARLLPAPSSIKNDSFAYRAYKQHLLKNLPIHDQPTYRSPRACATHTNKLHCLYSACPLEIPSATALNLLAGPFRALQQQQPGPFDVLKEKHPVPPQQSRRHLCGALHSGYHDAPLSIPHRESIPIKASSNTCKSERSRHDVGSTRTYT